MEEEKSSCPQETPTTCPKHGTCKALHEYSEKQEDIADGTWDTFGIEIEETVAAARERSHGAWDFDSGPCPDLHCEEGELLWKNYVPNHGPVINSPEEFAAYCKLTNHSVKGQKSVERRKIGPDKFGYDTGRTRKVVVDGGLETPWRRHFRRDRQELQTDLKVRDREEKAAWRAIQEAEKAKLRSKKSVFFMP